VSCGGVELGHFKEENADMLEVLKTLYQHVKGKLIEGQISPLTFIVRERIVKFQHMVYENHESCLNRKR